MKNNPQILIGCEESQAVTKAFRALGYEAYSCDTKECSGGHPEWHFKQDIAEVLEAKQWDMLITFPPCTHLAASGARYFEAKRKDGRQQQAIDFFLTLANAPVEKIAIENPIGIMSKLYRKPNQIVHPYYFGDPFQKSTCLWLKGLPLLTYELDPTVDKGTFKEYTDKVTGKTKRQASWLYDVYAKTHTKEERSLLRSKTFPGIANAMAAQWSKLL